MSGRREVLLTDEQWGRVKRFIPKVAHPMVVNLEPMSKVALRAFYGFSKVARMKYLPERFTASAQLRAYPKTMIFLNV